MIDGNTRRRTSMNAVRTRGDMSPAGGWYVGSRVISVSIARSASAVLPSARRQKARYCESVRASSGVRVVASGMRFSTASASS